MIPCVLYRGAFAWAEAFSERYKGQAAEMAQQQRKEGKSNMNFLNKMERKYGRYAIRNLMYYIIILYGIGFVVMKFAPSLYWGYLCLDVRAILHGQIWRLVTFLIYPPSTDFIYIIFSMYLYYMIGTQLEYQWGAFRFNVYFLTGVVGHILAAFIAYFALGLTGIYFPMTTNYLNLSLFFAYAALYPNVEFLLFFILPIKVKYLALLDGVFFVYNIFQSVKNGIMYSPAYFATGVCAIMSIVNFLLFFALTRNIKKYSYKEYNRKKTYRREVHQASRGSRHKCAICGRTEEDDPNLEFRYCSKCNGNYEYCQEHLFTHEHVK